MALTDSVPLSLFALQLILRFLAPTARAILSQSKFEGATDFLDGIGETVWHSIEGVSHAVLGERAAKRLQALDKVPNLDEALIVAIRKGLSDLYADISASKPQGFLNSFEQFFKDWDAELENIQTDEDERRELLRTKKFACLFYESEAAEKSDWWQPVKTQLSEWTNFNSLPLELEHHLREDFLSFANQALTETLHSNKYNEVWNEFHKVAQAEIRSIVTTLRGQIEELTRISQLAGGEFIRDGETIDFPMRASVDSVVRELGRKEIFIQRHVYVDLEKRVKIEGLGDLAGRGGYFLLTTAAGSGKSTLMAQWLRQFRETAVRERWTEVCYYFFSKRDRTDDPDNALTILADQLLKAHRIRADLSSSNPARVSTLVSQLLTLDSPRRLIVIIDGLDEAGALATRSDFIGLFRSMLPKTPGPNTTVILTMRDESGAGSLERLERDLQLELNALRMSEIDANALRSYLKEIENSKLKNKADDQKFVNRIISKTGGLAIYVHSLLDDLTNSDENDWDSKIETLPKAFEDYVTDPLAHHLSNLPQWQKALGFISLARSRLDEADLKSLTELSGEKINQIDFDGLKWPIKRWLKKEGKFWAFSHERIGELYYNRYVGSEKATYMRHLLSYCAEWKLSGSLYALQNYPELLETEKKFAELYELAGDRDFLDRQKEKLKDNPNAPLRTLGSAIRCAVEADNAAMMARFLLARAEIVRQISGESWLEAFDRRGPWGALELADHLGEPDRRVVWYFRIAERLIASRRNGEAVSVLEQLNQSPFPKLPSELWFVVDSALPVLLQTREFILVKTICSKAFPETEFGSKFAQAAIHFLETLDQENLRQFENLIDEAAIAARTIPARKALSHVLGTLAGILARANGADNAQNLFNEAIEMARLVAEPISKCRLLTDLARTLFAANCPEKANKLFCEAEHATLSITPEFLSREIENLVAALTQCKRTDEAQRLVQAAMKAGQLITKSPMPIRVPEEQLTGGPGQSHPASLKRLAINLCERGDVKRAAQVARSIPRSRFRFFALRHVASALADARKPHEAKQLFDEARKAALTSNALEFQSDDQFDLGPALADAVLFDDSHFDDRAEDNLEDREELDVPTPAFDSYERPHRSARMAMTRIIALDSLAISMTDGGHAKEGRELFAETKRFAKSLRGSELRSRALCQVATDLAAAKFFEDSEHTAREITTNLSRFRFKALGNLATALRRAGKYGEALKLFGEVRQGVKGIKRDAWSRSHVIRSIGIGMDEKELLEAVEKSASVKDVDSRSGTLMRLVAALTDAGYPGSLEQAENTAYSVETPKFLCQSLAIVGAAFVNNNRPDEGKRLFAEAEQKARSIRDFETRSQALGEIAFSLAKAKLFDESLRIMEELNGNNLLPALDEFAKAKLAAALKSHIVSLSYDTEAALRASAQMICLWEDQVDGIYGEVLKSI